MKKAEEVKPNFAPIYAAAMYPDLAKIFIKHGYALAVHGSLARDFDLIAVPWAEKISSPEVVLKAVEANYASDYFRVVDDNKATAKNHGRVAYTIAIGFGACSVDLSFFPLLTNQQ